MLCHIHSDSIRKDTKVKKYDASNIMSIIDTATNAEQNTTPNIYFTKIPIWHTYPNINPPILFCGRHHKMKHNTQTQNKSPTVALSKQQVGTNILLCTLSFCMMVCFDNVHTFITISNNLFYSFSSSPSKSIQIIIQFLACQYRQCRASNHISISFSIFFSFSPLQPMSPAGEQTKNKTKKFKTIALLFFIPLCC